jgi:hypothetical protein
LTQRDRLKTQLPNAVDRGVAGDDHFAILKNEYLLDELCMLLAPQAASTALLDPIPEPAE